MEALKFTTKEVALVVRRREAKVRKERQAAERKQRRNYFQKVRKALQQLKNTIESEVEDMKLRFLENLVEKAGDFNNYVIWAMNQLFGRYPLSSELQKKIVFYKLLHSILQKTRDVARREKDYQNHLKQQRTVEEERSQARQKEAEQKQKQADYIQHLRNHGGHEPHCSCSECYIDMTR